MQILMQQRIVHVSVEVSPVLRQVRNLLQQDPVHHDEVRSHLMKRPNIFRKIRQAKQQACPPPSNTSLDRLLNQLKTSEKLKLLSRFSEISIFQESLSGDARIY